MYDRDVDEQQLTFAVSGLLWNMSLVMIDDQTESLWSHILGEAMSGELEGTQLEKLPCALTDWSTWLAAHPQTTVVNLSRTTEDFRRECFEQPHSYVIGMARGAGAKAWPFDELIRNPVVNDTFEEVPIVVFFDAASGLATIFDRIVQDRTLTFYDAKGIVYDRDTKSRWNPVRGEATSGPLEGKRLTPRVGVVSYRRTWEVFHPQSTFLSLE